MEARSQFQPPVGIRHSNSLSPPALIARPLHGCAIINHDCITPPKVPTTNLPPSVLTSQKKPRGCAGHSLRPDHRSSGPICISGGPAWARRYLERSKSASRMCALLLSDTTESTGRFPVKRGFSHFCHNLTNSMSSLVRGRKRGVVLPSDNSLPSTPVTTAKSPVFGGSASMEQSTRNPR